MPHKTTLLIPQKRLAMPFHVFRGYPCLSCPFVSIRGSSPPCFLFSCLSCLSWLPLPFVSIRVHSWFPLSPHFFRVFRAFRGYPPAFRVLSCPFVVPTLPHISFVFFRTTVPYFYEMSAHVLASLAKGDQYRKNTSVTEEKPVFFARLLAKLRQMCYI